MMVVLGELRLEARLENVRTVAHFMRAVSQRLSLTEKVAFDLDLAVDEAVTNIVRHAYPDQQNGEMVITVQLNQNRLYIVLLDWGESFDPTAAKPFDKTAPIEDRSNGGMGLYFIEQLMDEVIRTPRRRRNDPNQLILIKHIEQATYDAMPRMTASRQLQALMNVSHVMSMNTDRDNLLRRIVDQLVNAVDAERGTLYLVDEEAGELYSTVLMEDSATLAEIRLKVGEGIAGQVAATGEIINLDDPYEDGRFIQQYDQITGFACRNMLAAPMRNPQQKIIGVVQLLNKRVGYFTARDERLLTAIAAQAAISVENARLSEQEMQQKLIQQELDTAHDIQKSFLPDTVPTLPGWDLAAYWHPMRDVAGDFYDFYTLPDERLAIVIADVAGKGIPAALFMAVSVTVLRFAMSLGLTPAQMLDRGNQTLIDTQHSRMFTTAFVGYLDPESGEVAYASAGHNPPLLYRQETGIVYELETSGVAMGVFRQAQYKDQAIILQPGDVLVLYTDGLTESLNAEDEEFGQERLIDVLGICAGEETAQGIINQVMAAVGEFTAFENAFDDETVLVIKCETA